MSKQSVNFTTPNENWLNEKVAQQEYSSKTELVNDLIRKEREREDKYNALKAAIDLGLSSGISSKSAEDIKDEALKRLSNNGQLPT